MYALGVSLAAGLYGWFDGVEEACKKSLLVRRELRCATNKKLDAIID